MILQTGHTNLLSLLLLLIQLISPPQNSQASSHPVTQPELNSTLESSHTLQAGDILLVPLNCYVCNAIEKETGVPYSHSVVVGNTTQKISDVFVYEAWGSSKKSMLTEILERAQKKEKLFHLRAKEFFLAQGPDEQQLAQTFETEFSRTSFDDEFLWDNVDNQGIEKLYCAEFVVKFINRFLTEPQQPSPMTFQKLADFWKQYYRQFNQPVPEGKLGASPATLFRSPLFVKLGAFPPAQRE